jgi:hypothetical protein
MIEVFNIDLMWLTGIEASEGVGDYVGKRNPAQSLAWPRPNAMPLGSAQRKARA